MPLTATTRLVATTLTPAMDPAGAASRQACRSAPTATSGTAPPTLAASHCSLQRAGSPAAALGSMAKSQGTIGAPVVGPVTRLRLVLLLLLLLLLPLLVLLLLLLLLLLLTAVSSPPSSGSWAAGSRSARE